MERICGVDVFTSGGNMAVPRQHSILAARAVTEPNDDIAPLAVGTVTTLGPVMPVRDDVSTPSACKVVK